MLVFFFLPDEPLFLTPLIEAGRLEEARSAALVDALTGPSIESYAGYLTVNKPACGSNMFFWYFPAKVRKHKSFKSGK